MRQVRAMYSVGAMLEGLRGVARQAAYEFNGYMLHTLQCAGGWALADEATCPECGALPDCMSCGADESPAVWLGQGSMPGNLISNMVANQRQPDLFGGAL